MLIDSRHGIKPVDEEILDLLDEAAVTYQAVLTKIDKVKPPAVPKVIEACEAALKSHAAAFPVALLVGNVVRLDVEDRGRRGAVDVETVAERALQRRIARQVCHQAELDLRVVGHE